MSAKNSPADNTRLTFAQKWGDDPFTTLGHTQVPNALIQYAARLQLKSEECWLICCILRFKYDVSNPCPKQDDLAKLFGQSIDTIQRTARKIEEKNLLKVERVRGELGRFTHTIYDFTPLRYALNECYYHDHPQERPIAPKQPLPPSETVTFTTPQNCGLDHTADLRPGDEREPHRRIAAWTTPQICGLYHESKNPAVLEESKENSSSRGSSADETDTQTIASAAAVETGLVKALIANDVNRADALRLAVDNPEECRRQLAYLPFVTEFRKGRGAYLRSAIEGGYGPPAGYQEALRAKEEARRRTAAQEREDAASAAREAVQQTADRQMEAYWHSLSREEQAGIEAEILVALKSQNAFLATRLAQGKSSPVVEATLKSLRRQLLADRLGLPVASDRDT